MAVLVKGGKVRTSNGKIRVGDAGESCCCGCCNPDGLASSYTVDVTGTWTIPTSWQTCNDPSVTSIILPEPTYAVDYEPSQVCFDGNSVELSSLNIPCRDWEVTVQFFADNGGVPETDGSSFLYRKRVQNCDDPTGIYDLVSTPGPGETVPSTITVS